MARFSVKHSKAGVNTANTIMWQIRAVSPNRALIVEMGISVKTAPTTGPSWRLVKAATIGTSSATVTPQIEDTAASVPVAISRLDTTWSSNPTLAATDHREYATPNAIGSGIVWTWYDKPFSLDIATGLLLVNGNATGATLGNFCIYIVLDE